MTLTPRLPRPPLRPRAVPAMRLGKNPGMLAMLEAKLPPPMPDSVARTAKVVKLVGVSCRAMPAPRAGTMSRAVVTAMVLRPPARVTRKELGMRSVAPERPAMLMRVNSWAGVKGNPASFMRTARMLQNIHTAKAASRAGMETARLRQAARDWPPPQRRDLRGASGELGHGVSLEVSVFHEVGCLEGEAQGDGGKQGGDGQGPGQHRPAGRPARPPARFRTGRPGSARSSG